MLAPFAVWNCKDPSDDFLLPRGATLGLISGACPRGSPPVVSNNLPLCPGEALPGVSEAKS